MLSRAASTACAARSLLLRVRRSDHLRSRNSFNSSSIASSPAEPQKHRAIDSSSALPTEAAAAAPQLALDGAATTAAAVVAPSEEAPSAAAATAAATAATAVAAAASLDEHFMRLALGQARQAALRGEVPVGALLVSRCGGTVLAAAGNGVESAGDATAHAELLCLQRAAAEAAAEAAPASSRGERGGASSSSSECSTSSSLPLLSSSATTLWPRSATAGSTLYVTLEPCAMCAGAALLARVGRIVYGARNAGAGADGSWVSLLPREDEEGEGGEGEGGAAFSYPSLTAPLPPRPHPSHPALEVTRGVLAHECGGLLKDFFRKRRAEGTRGGGGGGERRGGGAGV